MSSNSKRNPKSKPLKREKTKAKGKAAREKKPKKEKPIEPQLSLPTTPADIGLTNESSYVTSAQMMAQWLQDDIKFANKRRNDLEKLHDHLFSLEAQNEMDYKTLVTLYGMGIKDVNTRTNQMIKIAETSEKSRFLRNLAQSFADQVKKTEMSTNSQSHTYRVVQALLDESMRYTLEDEMVRKYGNNNSYRPPEDESYEVLAMDPNADES